MVEIPSADLREFQRLASQTWAAYAANGSLKPDDPRCEAAQAAVDDLTARMRAVEDRIFAKPASDPAAVQERAEVTKFWLSGAEGSTEFDNLDSPDRGSRASAYLLKAVLAMLDAGGAPRATASTSSTVSRIATELGRLVGLLETADELSHGENDEALPSPEQDKARHFSATRLEISDRIDALERDISYQEAETVGDILSMVLAFGVLLDELSEQYVGVGEEALSTWQYKRLTRELQRLQHAIIRGLRRFGDSPMDVDYFVAPPKPSFLDRVREVAAETGKPAQCDAGPGGGKAARHG